MKWEAGVMAYLHECSVFVFFFSSISWIAKNHTATALGSLDLSSHLQKFRVPLFPFTQKEQTLQRIREYMWYNQHLYDVPPEYIITSKLYTLPKTSKQPILCLMWSLSTNPISGKVINFYEVFPHINLGLL